MKYLLMSALLLSVVLISCDTKKEEEHEGAEMEKMDMPAYITRIKDVETRMRASETLDKNIAIEAINLYSQFVSNFPEDTICADYLFKAGEISTSIGSYQQAINYFKELFDKYPNFKYVTESLYMQGFIYDSYINDDAKAKEIYQQLIAKYPKHTLAEDAKAAINNLGKTDEELIREFQKKNGEKVN